MRKLVFTLFMFTIILVGCDSNQVSNADDNIREEVWQESIKIANAVNYFVENEIIVPMDFNNDLLERWFPDLEFTDKEKELYDSIIQLVLTGHGVVKSNFDDYNVGVYNENYNAVVEIIGEDSISNENLDMKFVKEMQQIGDSSQYEQETSTAPLTLEESSCGVENGIQKSKGFIKNNDSISYSYVRVQVTYFNESGAVVDTDWTYAVDSQPLQPDERRSYEILSNTNDQIKNCKWEITDYQ